jgi:hypothetical protein
METELFLDDDGLEALAERLADDTQPDHEVPDVDLTAAAPSEELVAVTRRIATQYVDVLHASASAAFGRCDTQAAATQLHSALQALDRLAAAGGDAAHRAILADILPEASRHADAPHGKSRHRFLSRLRHWLARYADHLGDPDGRRIRALVSYNVAEVPLFSELAAIPGIGPRRLERLFCAGLYAVEVVSAADPVEVAQVTGLPRNLAADVVRRAREWADERQRQVVVELHARLGEFQRMLASLDRTTHPELWALAQAAVVEMSSMVQASSQEGTA